MIIFTHKILVKAALQLLCFCVVFTKGQFYLTTTTTSAVPALSWCHFQNACMGYVPISSALPSPRQVQTIGEAAAVLFASIEFAGLFRVTDAQSLHGSTCTTSRNCPTLVFGSVLGVNTTYQCPEVTAMGMQGFGARSYTHDPFYEVRIVENGSCSLSPGAIDCKSPHSFILKAREGACGPNVCDCQEPFSDAVEGWGACTSSGCTAGDALFENVPPPSPAPVIPPSPSADPSTTSSPFPTSTPSSPTDGPTSTAPMTNHPASVSSLMFGGNGFLRLLATPCLGILMVLNTIICI